MVCGDEIRDDGGRCCEAKESISGLGKGRKQSSEIGRA